MWNRRAYYCIAKMILYCCIWCALIWRNLLCVKCIVLSWSSDAIVTDFITSRMKLGVEYFVMKLDILIFSYCYWLILSDLNHSEYRWWLCVSNWITFWEHNCMDLDIICVSLCCNLQVCEFCIMRICKSLSVLLMFSIYFCHKTAPQTWEE